MVYSSSSRELHDKRPHYEQSDSDVGISHTKSIWRKLECGRQSVVAGEHDTKNADDRITRTGAASAATRCAFQERSYRNKKTTQMNMPSSTRR